MSYLSIVAVGSNRGYGGNFLARMQNWLDNLYKFGGELNADITIVEWAYPEDRPRIYDALRFSDKIRTRVVSVPEIVQDSLPNPHGEKFFEYHAKNVGIRRAEGEFILSTNPDNLYSPELLKRIAGKDLNKKSFYRANRYDVGPGLKILSANFNTGTRYPDGSSTEGERTNPDSNALHFNAAGDFILMHRDAWTAIKGHPEVPYSLTVDGQTVFLAAQEGLKQVILPKPMFHQDHSRTDKYAPYWSDREPWGTKNDNDSWGLADHTFETRYL